MDLLVLFWLVKGIIFVVFGYKLVLLQSVKVRAARFPTEMIYDQYVCVQAPIYCEPDHVEGLIHSLARLDWPPAQLEIQILDDSRDQTSHLARRAIKEVLRLNPHLNIKHITRKDRTGFKAGALNHGMTYSRAAFFAIFDCDFRPEPSFLKTAMRHFMTNEKIAAVQLPWCYRNTSQNQLTRFQSALLNVHFNCEQVGRFASGKFFNFNGTAGIWKREALLEIGGWSDATVTEDLYLSYQIQMRGWKLVFDSSQAVSSELPSTIDAFRIQQCRWAQGNGEVLRLMWQPVLKSPLPIATKFDIFFHLLGYGLGSLVVGLYLFAPLWIKARGEWLDASPYWNTWRLFDTAIWVSLALAFFLVYASKRVFHPEGLSGWRRCYHVALVALISPLPAFLTVGSYFKGFATGFGRKRVFSRTPKSQRYLHFSVGGVAATLLTSYLGYLAYVSIESSQYVLSALFLSQGFCLFLLLATCLPVSHLYAKIWDILSVVQFHKLVLRKKDV